MPVKSIPGFICKVKSEEQAAPIQKEVRGVYPVTQDVEQCMAQRPACTYKGQREASLPQALRIEFTSV